MRELAKELKEYCEGDVYPFHMPGHKRRGAPWHLTDITEIDGFDNLHDPSGIIRVEMDRAREYYGTKETFFLVNGSTCGILSAISASVPRGGRLMMWRGSHISAYHAAELLELELVFADETPPEDAEDERYKADAVFITSPLYDGTVRDVSAWAAFAKRRGIPLIVDEAHGAHFSMHPYFPVSAVKLGADIVIQSAHKTLPAMTGTALLHNVTGLVDSLRIQHFLDIYETSSPSYVMLSSLTAAVNLCASKEGKKAFDDYAARLRSAREALLKLRVLALVGGDDPSLSDPGKIMISCAAEGRLVYEKLVNEYRIQPEMCGRDFVLFMTSFMDTEEGFRRLAEALSEIDAELALSMEHSPGTYGKDGADAGASGHDGSGGPQSAGSPVYPLSDTGLLPPTAMRLSEAYGRDSEAVPLSEANGRISADYVIIYPPDCPLIIPGEVFTEDVIGAVRAGKASGDHLIGIDDGGNVRCLL